MGLGFVCEISENTEGILQISVGANAKKIDSAVLTLQRLPSLKILIKGHTSTEGDATRNLQLSEQRAEAVRNYLISKGIAAQRLQTHGLGSSQPLTSENSEEDRKRNRRIEFEIMNQ